MHWICTTVLIILFQEYTKALPPGFTFPPQPPQPPNPTRDRIVAGIQRWLVVLDTTETGLLQEHVNLELVEGTGTTNATTGLIRSVDGREALDNIWQVVARIKDLRREYNNHKDFITIYHFTWNEWNVHLQQLSNDLGRLTFMLYEAQEKLISKERSNVIVLATQTESLLNMQLDVIQVIIESLDLNPPNTFPMAHQDQVTICETFGEIKQWYKQILERYTDLLVKLDEAFAMTTEHNRERSGFPYEHLSKFLSCVHDLSVWVNLQGGLDLQCRNPEFGFFLENLVNWLRNIQTARTKLYDCALDLRYEMLCLNEDGVSTRYIRQLTDILERRRNPDGTLQHALEMIDGKIITIKRIYVNAAIENKASAITSG